MRDKESPKTLLAILLLFVIFGSALAFSPPSVSASVGCDSVIMSDTTLGASIGPCSGSGLVIGSNGVALNCAGYTILGTSTNVGFNSTGAPSVGINLTGISNATVENCNVMGFQFGFMLANSSNNTLAENTADNNSLCGFAYSSSRNDVLSNNTADSNGYYGFALIASTGNTLTENTANGNGFVGFLLFNSSSGNTLITNTANNNHYYGFFLWSASGNTLTGSTANSNTGYGYYDYSSGSGTAGTANLYSSDKCSGNGAGGSSPRGLCPFISLAPSSGSVGSPVTMTGSGFVASHVVNATFASWVRACPPDSVHCDIVHLTYVPLALGGSCTTSATGLLGGCTFIVPSVSDSLSQHTITVTDGTNSLNATFTVLVPSIFLSPSFGAAGTSVSVAGSGFTVSHSLAVTYDGSTAGMPVTCATDAFGNTSAGCTFIVPSSSVLGNHTIAVSDGTNSPTATFTVTLLGVTCSRSTVVVGSTTTCKATVHESGTKAPTGTVTWSSSGSGVFSSTTCTVSRHKTFSTCSVKFTPMTAGSSVSLTAYYGGDANDTATVGGYNLIVTMKATRTAVSCSPASVPANSSRTITCKAKVTGYLPTGNVIWRQSGTGSVSYVTATCALSVVSLSVSSCSVTMTGYRPGSVALNASYGGDSNNTPSSRTHSLNVRRALTSIAIACSQTTLSIGVPVTCTATVLNGYSPTGTVTWARASGAGRVTFSSKTCTLSSGSCQVTITATKAGSIKIKASYGGDSDNLKSAGILVPSILIMTPLPKSASTTNVGLGLTFSLTLNSTVLQRGQTVGIMANVTNALSTPNNQTEASDWSESWLLGWNSIDSCNSLANAQVFQGYYTQSNISSIQNGPGPYGLQLAKPLNPLLECPFVPGAWSTFFPFQPHASRVGYYYSANGYYANPESSNPAFTLFKPGPYTVVAGDEWGQLVILHFVVTP